MRRAIGLLALAALLLSGCAALPTSSDVSRGDVITDNSDTRVDLLPSDPRPGADPQEILEGFLQAVTSPRDKYAIARKYLATNVREIWNPDKIVYITPSTPAPPVLTGPASAVYSISPMALLDEKGIYTTDEAGDSELSLTFGLIQQDGEWRINQLKDGIVLSANNFAVVFAEYPLYFFDPTYSYLVPDVRWFPQTSLIATRISTALAEGPAPWLQSAVVSAFPTGTTVETRVTIDSGTATVNLSDEAADATDQQKARIQQQLRSSLALATVSSVALEIGLVTARVDPAAAIPAIPQPTVAQQPLVSADGAFGFITSAGMTPVPGIASAVEALKPLGVTYAIGSGVAAVRAADGVYRVDKSGQSHLLDPRTDLLDPSLDPQGFVWVPQSSAADTIVAYAKDGSPHSVTVAGVATGERLLSFDLSRDGARALLVVSTGSATVNSTRVLVAGVTRPGQDGVPTRLDTPLELATLTNRPVDATWVDDSTVATLTQFAAGSSVTAYDLGGPSSPLGIAPTGSVALVGGNDGEDGLRVLDSDHSLLRLRSSNWQATGLSADLLATQVPG